MPTATLTVELPEDVWIGRVSRRYPDARIQVLAAVAEGREGVVMGEIRSDTVDSILRDIQTADDVSEITVLEHRESKTLIQVETVSAILLDHAQQSGVPIKMPFNVRDGQAVWKLTSSHEKLSELGDTFAAEGIPFTVESMTYDVDRQNLLSEPQWKVLTTAVQKGYYDTPRACTQTELADELDLAKSTCSETLHRAEERIVKQFLVEHPDIVISQDLEESPVESVEGHSFGRAD